LLQEQLEKHKLQLERIKVDPISTKIEQQKAHYKELFLGW
jgi:hypothetical protein